MNLEVGATYELYVRGAAHPGDTVVVLVVAACGARVTRYRVEAGYRLLVLAASGYHGDVQPGHVYEWPERSPILGRSVRLA